MENTGYYINLINAFVKHYNMCNETNKHMFHDIDEIDGTNDLLEEFYEHLGQFKESEEEDKKLFSPNDINPDSFEQLFGLSVNGKVICVCCLLIPLLDYIVKEIDIVKTQWKIIPLKIT